MAIYKGEFHLCAAPAVTYYPFEALAPLAASPIVRIQE